MFKFKYLPQYFLALLLLILLFLEGWTWYLGTTGVTFKRYLSAEVPPYVQEISLRRYKAAHSPHLFTMEVDANNEEKLINWLVGRCHMQRVSPDVLPASLTKVDDEMVEVIRKSPVIYMTTDPKQRFCLLFRDKEKYYLYLEGDLEKR